MPEHPESILALIRAYFFGVTTSATFANTTYGEDIPVCFA